MFFRGDSPPLMKGNDATIVRTKNTTQSLGQILATSKVWNSISPTFTYKRNLSTYSLSPSIPIYSPPPAYPPLPANSAHLSPPENLTHLHLCTLGNQPTHTSGVLVIMHHIERCMEMKCKHDIGQFIWLITIWVQKLPSLLFKYTQNVQASTTCVYLCYMYLC